MPLSTLYSRRYYEANREAILAQQRVRRQAPAYKDKMRVYYANYYRTNRQRILVQSRERRAERRVKAKADKAQPFAVVQGKVTVTFD